MSSPFHRIIRGHFSRLGYGRDWYSRNYITTTSVTALGRTLLLNVGREGDSEIMSIESNPTPHVPCLARPPPRAKIWTPEAMSPFPFFSRQRWAWTVRTSDDTNY